MAYPVSFEMVKPVQHLAEERPRLCLPKRPPVRDQVKQLTSSVERRDDVDAVVVPQRLFGGVMVS